MADSGKINSPKPDSSSSNQSQKVEVVVASSSDGDVNILGELATFVLRVSFSLFMIHHGLEKLQDPDFREAVCAIMDEEIIQRFDSTQEEIDLKDE